LYGRQILDYLKDAILTYSSQMTQNEVLLQMLELPDDGQAWL